MTRKDYQRLAGALHRALPTEPMTETLSLRDIREQRRRTWERAMNEVANTLAADNPHFDRGRFIKACVSGKGAVL